MVGISYLVWWLVGVLFFFKHNWLSFISSVTHWPSFKKHVCALDVHLYKSEDFILDMFTIKDNSAEFQLSEQ